MDYSPFHDPMVFSVKSICRRLLYESITLLNACNMDNPVCDRQIDTLLLMASEPPLINGTIGSLFMLVRIPGLNRLLFGYMWTHTAAGSAGKCGERTFEEFTMRGNVHWTTKEILLHKRFLIHAACIIFYV